MFARVNEILSGLGSNLRFSNRCQVVFDRVFRRHLPLTHYVWKNRFSLVCNCRFGDHASLHECLCRRVYDPFLKQCRFPDNRLTYINVGANIGAFDVMLVDAGLTIKAGVAVELNPSTFARCAVNLEANGLTTTQAVNAGVSGTNGRLRFQPSRCSLGDNIFSGAPTGGEPGGSPIELLSLESLLARYCPGHPEIDLLKLDCEGAEYGIVRLSPVPVLRRFRHIIAEFHAEPAGESAKTAYARLREAGFRWLLGQPRPFNYTDIFVRD